jgi:hypothetical protein
VVCYQGSHCSLSCLAAIRGLSIGFSLNITPSWKGIPHYRRCSVARSAESGRQLRMLAVASPDRAAQAIQRLRVERHRTGAPAHRFWGKRPMFSQKNRIVSEWPSTSIIVRQVRMRGACPDFLPACLASTERRRKEITEWPPNGPGGQGGHNGPNGQLEADSAGVHKVHSAHRAADTPYFSVSHNSSRLGRSPRVIRS